jgi:hypothetical protein
MWDKIVTQWFWDFIIVPITSILIASIAAIFAAGFGVLVFDATWTSVGPVVTFVLSFLVGLYNGWSVRITRRY